jgi:hypothetical protein
VEHRRDSPHLTRGQSVFSNFEKTRDDGESKAVH